MATTSTPDALNAFVRVLLSKTPPNPAPARYQLQNAADAKRYFGGLCAYCVKRASDDFDHAIPINRRHLGEHVIGNLIPNCRFCNDEKKNASRPYGLDFRQFLSRKESGTDRITKVATYMNANGHIPLGDDPAIRALVETVRANVVKALEDCVSEIQLRRCDKGLVKI